MPRTPCCCGVPSPCCEGEPLGPLLLVDVTAWAPTLYTDCIPVGEYLVEYDPDLTYEFVTGMWYGSFAGSGEPGCSGFQIYLYCIGTTPDEWTLDILMDGEGRIFQDNPQPDRTCAPLYLPFRESDIAIDVTTYVPP